MKNKTIPKVSKSSSSHSLIKEQNHPRKMNGISFSFEALERTDYFNLDGTCNNWPSELFELLGQISKIEKKELISGKYANSTYRIHTHEKANPPSDLPDGIQLKDLYQIRIEKSKGGIHGVFYENIFYVIWLDPLHNMYPDKKYGGLRKINPPNTCCMVRDERIDELMELNKQLEAELSEYKELFDNI